MDFSDRNVYSEEILPGKYRIRSKIIKRTKNKKDDPTNVSGKPSGEFIYSNEFTIKEKSAVDTSNWQTYQNEEFGFEVKYPESWTFRDQHAGTLLLKPTFDNLSRIYFSIDAIGHVVDSPSVKKEFKKTIFAKREAEEFNLVEKKFILREIRILEIDGKWTKNNNIFYYVENNKKDLIPILNQILSTFKFIN